MIDVYSIELKYISSFDNPYDLIVHIDYQMNEDDIVEVLNIGGGVYMNYIIKYRTDTLEDMVSISKSPKKGNYYINRVHYHSELTLCKKVGKLSPMAVRMLMTHAENVSKVYYMSNAADKADAISSAIYDCMKYWRSFHHANLIKLPFQRHILPGEGFILYINGCNEPVSLIAGKDFETYYDADNLYKPLSYVNKTLDNMNNHILSLGIDDRIKITLNKTKYSMTVTDVKNQDRLINISKAVVVTSTAAMPFLKNYAGVVDDDGEMKFINPPNAFSYFTTMLRNGVLKHINKINPKQLRNGGLIHMSHVNKDNNGLFNI